MYRFSYFNKLIKTSITTLFLIVISVEIYTGGRKGEEKKKKENNYIRFTIRNIYYSS